MLRLWIFIINMLKYLILSSIMALITNHFYPGIGIIVFVLGIMGGVGIVSYGFEERYNKALEKREQNRILKVVKKNKDEFEGFEQAIELTRKNMS